MLKSLKRYALLCVLLLTVIPGVFSLDIPAVIKIEKVSVKNGTVFVAVYFNETSYKNDNPERTFALEPSETVLTIELNLPDGDYVVTAYQDTNGNEKLDTGIFGIPKEPVAKSNWNGTGHPGPWKKLKASITDSTPEISICLYKL